MPNGFIITVRVADEWIVWGNTSPQVFTTRDEARKYVKAIKRVARDVFTRSMIVRV